MKVRRLGGLRQPRPRYYLYTDYRGRVYRMPSVLRRVAHMIRALGTP